MEGCQTQQGAVVWRQHHKLMSLVANAKAEGRPGNLMSPSLPGSAPETTLTPVCEPEEGGAIITTLSLY